MEMSHYAPPIEPLFDSFWHTRELALLFGAAGTGKSGSPAAPEFPGL